MTPGHDLYKFLIVSGSDALTFLQGQLTQDLERLEPGKCLPAAWCNAQGRVLMTLRVVRSGDLFALAVAQDIVESAMSRLQMYRLRSKVEFSVGGPDWQLYATPVRAERPVAAPGETWFLPIPGDPAITEVVERDRQTAAAPISDEAWQAARIRSGYVDISTANSTLYTPHMLNLDRCGAVSFEKGCYTGQEIVARTEHRGHSRRRTLRFSCDAPMLAVGDTLNDAGSDIGTVVNAAGNECLAVVPLDARDKSLSIRGHAANLRPLPYSVGE